MMGGSTLQFTMILLAAAVLGATVSWLIRGVHSRRSREQAAEQWQLALDAAIGQRDRFKADIFDFRNSIEAHHAVVREHEASATRNRIELESALEKTKSLSKDLITLRAERDAFKVKINESQSTLNSAKQQTAGLQGEFVKAGQFYKGELAKSFDKRKGLETKLENAKLEHESLSNLLEAARSEHESAKKMLASAQTRLANLDAIEQKVIELEAENAQIRHDARRTIQEIEALRRDVVELDELKIQNRELAHCLQSMENSRKQYETDAKRHRDHAGQFEQQSETLRIKLDEVEKNFADMETQQLEALKIARKAEIAHKSNGQTPPKHEKDDLTKIVGIGKVFEQSLHKLGIFSFQQIATFGVADIARLNLELKEFRGRMEQDDWIGQAKELYYKKCSESN